MIRIKYLIKPRLQIKYMLITAAVVVLSAVVVYFLMHQVLRSSGGMEQLTTGEWLALERAIDRSFLWIVAFIALILAVESIFFFHKMIGPLYVFEKVLRAVKEGDLTQRVNLRQGDEFKEIAAEYNAMTESISAKVDAARAAAERLSAGDASASARLKEVLGGFNTGQKSG